MLENASRILECPVGSRPIHKIINRLPSEHANIIRYADRAWRRLASDSPRRLIPLFFASIYTLNNPYLLFLRVSCSEIFEL